MSKQSFSHLAQHIFFEAIATYERSGGVDIPCPESFSECRIEQDLFRKNWIDHRQWGLEDIIRDPDIDPIQALDIKRRIDRSNQERTDLVELIDSYFWEQYHSITPLPNASINTESPAWAIDRLSILCLKIHHMTRATERAESTELRTKCSDKLSILNSQLKDLCQAIDELLEDIAQGRKYMKVYKQMKMYNDPELNPMLKGQSL